MKHEAITSIMAALRKVQFRRRCVFIGKLLFVAEVSGHFPLYLHMPKSGEKRVIPGGHIRGSERSLERQAERL
jgi:hypothetical protein